MSRNSMSSNRRKDSLMSSRVLIVEMILPSLVILMSFKSPNNYKIESCPSIKAPAIVSIGMLARKSIQSFPLYKYFLAICLDYNTSSPVRMLKYDVRKFNRMSMKKRKSITELKANIQNCCCTAGWKATKNGIEKAFQQASTITNRSH